MSTWGITSGAAGMEAQVRALGGALDIPVEMKKAQLRKPFVYLPNNVFSGALSRCVFSLLSNKSETISPPWPELVISCGRRGAVVALGIKAQSPQTKLIHIGDPYVNPGYFNAIVAMQHDKIAAPNVIKTQFALHTITPAKLEEAKVQFAPKFEIFPMPRVTVLLGGSTNKYTLDEEGMKHLVTSLSDFQRATGASLLITPSRRTGAKNIELLREAFAANERVFIYNFGSENPYLGLLALADAIVVTNDSVNMMSEAYATGKPIYVLPLPGHAHTKPARFADRLLTEGSARVLGRMLESWSYQSNNEMAELKHKLIPFL